MTNEVQPAVPVEPPAAPAAAPVPAVEPPAPGAPAAAPPAAEDEPKQILGADGPKPLDQVIPDKYRVKKDDGTVDVEASFRKTEEARAALEARMGTGDVRPKTVDEYKLVVPDNLKALAATLPEEGVKAFQAKAFAQGFTQKQYEFAVAEFLDQATVMVTAGRSIDSKSAVAELKATWPVEADFNSNVERANNAIRGYGGDDAAGIFKDYGNDPRIVRMMAKIGAEMGEDRAPNMAQPSTGAVDIQALMRSEAYTNAKHADHARVSQQVRDYFQRNEGKKAA